MVDVQGNGVQVGGRQSEVVLVDHVGVIEDDSIIVVEGAVSKAGTGRAVWVDVKLHGEVGKTSSGGNVVGHQD